MNDISQDKDNCMCAFRLSDCLSMRTYVYMLGKEEFLDFHY